MVEVKGPSGGHLVQPPVYLQALVLLACQGFRGVIEAASHLSLFAPLCQPWCLPEPILNSFQLSDLAGHLQSGSKNGLSQLCWNSADQERAGKCSSWQITMAFCGATASLCISP